MKWAKTFIIIFLLILIGIIIMAGINHERIVASRDKGLAEDWNADHEQTGNHDVEQHQFLNNVIENVVAFPGGPVKGQVVYRTDENQLYIYNGTDWFNYDLEINKLSIYRGAPAMFVADNIGTAVSWNNEEYDLNNMFNPAVPVSIDINEDGYYLVNARITWDGITPANSYLWIQEGLNVLASTQQENAKSSEVNKVLYLENGDILVIYVQQWGDAAANTLEGHKAATYLTVTKLK